uniref:KTSC domain-containing protein n=1 Tax=Haemonchus placei TaxID=6290 RepID=A0A0N4WFK8_HAEPC
MTTYGEKTVIKDWSSETAKRYRVIVHYEPIGIPLHTLRESKSYYLIPRNYSNYHDSLFIPRSVKLTYP